MKWIKRIIIVLSLIILALIFMIIFSPYGKHDGFTGRLVINTVVVDASVEEVYNYLGNSDNAEDWSVYVDHITALNPDTHADGEVGAIRRCFKTEDENGIIWDEEILITEKNQRRRLSVYDLQGFSLMSDNLLTEQLYHEQDGKCAVSLTLFFDEGKSSWIDELKLYFAGYTVSSIFQGNLEGIKELNE